MPEINETELPGLGLRHDFMARCGQRVGVVSRPSGKRELLLYDTHDPDAVRDTVDLTQEESGALAELLGGSAVTEHLAGLTQGVIPGLSIDWSPIPATFAPRTIGDLGIRTRTGASVVAVIRDGEAIPAPGQEFELRSGDTAVIVGTADGIKAAEELLQ
jgi:TrkA domain protein